MEKTYVCSGAKMYCSFGDKIADLVVFPDRTVNLSGSPMANVSDHISMSNIRCFGKCHTVAYPPTGSATSANHGVLTPMACVPGTLFDWDEGKDDYVVKGKAALLNTSYCRCKWGGVISILNDGQHSDIFDSAYYERLLADSFKEEEESLAEEKKEEEHPWLDLAEYIPVAGSILGMYREAKKGNWWMVALNAGFLVLDVAGLFTFGATTAASTAAKAGTKAALKATGKYLARETMTGAAVGTATGAALGKSSELLSKKKGGKG